VIVLLCTLHHLNSLFFHWLSAVGGTRLDICKLSFVSSGPSEAWWAAGVDTERFEDTTQFSR